jgi:ubiquinone/menaquinone biosynthesis C-methylase UbiE
MSGTIQHAAAKKLPLHHRLLEHPIVFSLNQKLNPWTVGTYENYVRTRVKLTPAMRVLDIGCGLGAHKPMLTPGKYTGIDINAEYVAHASRRYGNGFLVMDANSIAFPDRSFEAAVSVATCHHLSDDVIKSMISEVLRILTPEGILHIIDPVLPINPLAKFKTRIFLSDRGQFQRTLPDMRALLSSCANIVDEDLDQGRLHDVCYFALTA